MLTQVELNKILREINTSYDRHTKRIEELEKQVAQLQANNAKTTTSQRKTAEKT